MRAVDVLRRRFELEQACGSAQSALGPQLRRAQGESAGLVQLGQEHTQEELARHVLMTKDLTADEEQVCRLRLLGWSDHVTRDRCVAAADAVPQVLVPGGPLTCVTRRGEEMVGLARDDHGAVVDGQVMVRGVTALPPSWTTIGEQMGIPKGRAAALYNSAVTKVVRRLNSILQTAAA